MSSIAFTVDAAGLRKFGDRLHQIEARIPRAIALGLNEGGDKVRTRVQQQLKVQTNVRLYKSITSRVRTARAYGGSSPVSGIGPIAPSGLVYQIIATGKGIPIEEFPVRLTREGVDAKTWGVDHLFKRSFGITGQGVGGFRARLGPKRFPIRKLYGPALPKELGQGGTPTVFYFFAGRFVPPALIRQLGRVL